MSWRQLERPRRPQLRDLLHPTPSAPPPSRAAPSVLVVLAVASPLLLSPSAPNSATAKTGVAAVALQRQPPAAQARRRLLRLRHRDQRASAHLVAVGRRAVLLRLPGVSSGSRVSRPADGATTLPAQSRGGMRSRRSARLVGHSYVASVHPTGQLESTSPSTPPSPALGSSALAYCSLSPPYGSHGGPVGSGS